ncbi:MAG: hypothetical protein J0H98_02810 [Solirubrobacterales bacterium]|nr:hypothetical protein [Solirubrobacterales bacterium]
MIGLVAGSAVLTMVAAVIPFVSDVATQPSASAAVASVTLATLLGVGLYAWARVGTERFGKVLFLTGLCWFMATLSNADGEFLYSVGRIFGWLFELALVYALLAYPTGRIEDRAGKAIAVVAVALICVGFLPTVPFVDQYPLPAPFVHCGQECPRNFFSVASEPDLIEQAVKPLRDAVTLAIYLAVALVLAARLRGVGPNLRRTQAPVMGAAILRFLVAGAYVALRRAGADEDLVDTAAFVGMLTISITAGGFLVGLLQWRIYVGRSLLRLTTGVNEAADTEDLRSLAADCLDDPSVDLFYTDPPGTPEAVGWRDSSGRPSDEPEPSEGKLVTIKAQPDGSRLAVSCEEGLGSYPRFLDAVCSTLAAGLERQRLDHALTALLRDVAASRKRLASAGDNARRKIERDLHDGAQQRLVALRVKLELARDALEQDPAPAPEVVAALGPEVDEIIDEVRALAHGIYPPLLASSGLAEALRSAALRSPLAASVEAEEIGRLPSETESAVYFCVLEALQNATKHAEGASGVVVRLWREDGIRVEVRDDGAGFDPAAGHAGSGITGMRDRLEAQGGWLRVDSRQGEGTRVIGCVPEAR